MKHHQSTAKKITLSIRDTWILLAGNLPTDLDSWALERALEGYSPEEITTAIKSITPRKPRWLHCDLGLEIKHKLQQGPTLEDEFWNRT